jgi:hypothetical protein
MSKAQLLGHAHSGGDREREAHPLISIKAASAGVAIKGLRETAMTELSDLRRNFRYVRLLPPREADPPEDERGTDDDLRVPLDEDGRLGPPAWRGDQALGRVRYSTRAYKLAEILSGWQPGQARGERNS